MSQETEIARAMSGPVNISDEYMEISRKLLSYENLPEGAYTAHLRSIYALSDGSVPFDEWVIEYERMTAAITAIRNEMHPIVFDETIKLGGDHFVKLFKRDGEGWSCQEGCSGPYGGSGNTTINRALEIIPKYIRLRVDNIGDLRDYSPSDQDDVMERYHRENPEDDVRSNGIGRRVRFSSGNAIPYRTMLRDVTGIPSSYDFTIDIITGDDAKLVSGDLVIFVRLDLLISHGLFGSIVEDETDNG
jgi:hypothetical protein